MAAAAGAAGGINLTTLWVNVAPSVAGLASKMQQHGHTAAVNFNDSFTKEWQRNLDTVSRTFTGALTEVSRASSTLISDMFSGQYPEPPDMSMFTNAMNDLVGKAGEIGIAMTAWMPVIGEVAGNFITTWTGAFQEVFGVAGQLTQVFYEMGNAWQEIGREILGVTGASRAELENYMGVVQDILASGDIVHMNDVVSAIGIIGDRMENITNPQLREFTTIVAQSQELLGKLDVAQAIAALNQWGIASDEAAGKFTGLVHVAQETKAPFDVLTRQMIQSGPILQQFGLNFDQVALFMGKMHKQGFELTRFAYQFQRAASDITREGKPLANALDEIRVTAENMLASGNEVGATQYLEGLFGPYGWPRLIGMLRTAKDEFANFTSDVSAGLNQNTEEINDQVNRTADLGEQFVVIRNRLMADFRVVSQGFADHLTQAGDNLQEWTAKHYGDMLGAARGFANGMITAVGGITDLAAGALGVISPMLNPIIDVTVAWAQVILSTIQTVTDVGSILPDWLVIGESDDWAKISSSIQTPKTV